MPRTPERFRVPQVERTPGIGYLNIRSNPIKAFYMYVAILHEEGPALDSTKASIIVSTKFIRRTYLTLKYSN